MYSLRQHSKTRLFCYSEALNILTFQVVLSLDSNLFQIKYIALYLPHIFMTQMTNYKLILHCFRGEHIFSFSVVFIFPEVSWNIVLVFCWLH